MPCPLSKTKVASEAAKVGTGVAQNQQILESHLAEAEHQLAELAARVERQKGLVQRLEAGGQYTAHATFLLQQAIGLKALHEAHRDWVKRELTVYAYTP